MPIKGTPYVRWLVGCLAILVFIDSVYACTVLRVAARADNPPLSFVHKQTLRGIGVDLLPRLLNKVSSPPSVRWSEPLPWKRALALVKTGQLDAVLGFDSTIEKDPDLVLVTPALTQTAYSVFYKKGRFPKGLPKKSMIGHMGATVLGSEVGLNLEQKKLQLIPVSSLEAAAKMVLGERIDYFIAPLLSSIHILYQENRILLDGLTFAEDSIVRTNQYIALSRKSPCHILSAALGQQIANAQASGLLDQALGESLAEWEAFEWYIQNRDQGLDE